MQGDRLETGAALRPIRGGDRLKVKGKLATVVGANRGRLWVRRDGVGEQAWYLERDRIEEVQEREAFVKDEHEADLAAKRVNVARDSDESSEETVAAAI